MIIPHNEKSIKRVHLSNGQLFFLGGLLFVSLIVSLGFLLHHSVQSKELENLKKYHPVNQKNIEIYRSEAEAFYRIARDFRLHFNKMRPFFNSKPENLPFGIGGNEIEIQDLSEELRSHLKAQEREKDSEEKSLEEIRQSRDDLKQTYELAREMNRFLQKRIDFFTAFPTLWPVKSKNGVADRFPGSLHKLRIRLVGGEPVVATGEGSIKTIRFSPKNKYTVVIDHGYGILTQYRRLIRVFVEKEDVVSRGTKIGLSSRTLDYRVKIASAYVDPLELIIVR